AGAGDEQTAWRQEADGAVVDLAIGAQCALQSLSSFGEGRRIEHDRVELAALLLEGAQRLDRVLRAGFHIVQVVAARVLAGALHSSCILVDGENMPRLSRKLQREAAVVAEGVQRFAPCQLAGAEVV